MKNDPVIDEIKVEADRIVEAFLGGELTYLEAQLCIAKLDVKGTKKIMAYVLKGVKYAR